MSVARGRCVNRSRRAFVLSSLSLAWAAVASSAAGADDATTLTATQIVERVLRRDAFGREGGRARIRLVVRGRHGGERIHTLDAWTRRAGGGLETLVRLRAPAETAGMAFLLVESGGRNEQYVYLPSLKKTRRIVGREQGFLGSDFTYADPALGSGRAATHRPPDEAVGDVPALDRIHPGVARPTGAS